MSNSNLRGKAVVATEPNRVDFLPVDIAPPRTDEVVIRVEFSWISNGTESSFIRGERIAGDTPRQNHDPCPFPHIPGYQKCGIVEWVGSAVEEIKVGDRVFTTVSNVQGMFFDYAGHISPAVAHISQVWKLPDEVSSLAASGLVLTQVGFNCGMRPPVKSGDTAVVLGDGLVGHWTAQTLAHRGARVLLAGRHQDRLTRFAARTEDCVVNTKQQKLLHEVENWAPQGVNVVVDTVGSIEDLTSLYPFMQRQGHLVSAGYYGANGQIDIQPMRDLELTLHTPSGWTRPRMDETLRLLHDGALHTKHLITHRFSAREAALAYDLILSRKESVLGVVLDWTA